MRNFVVLNPVPANQMAFLAAAEELLPEFMEETGPIVRKAIDYASKAAAARELYRDVKGVGKRVGGSLSRARKMARSYNPFTRAGRAGIGSLERRAGLRRAKRPPKRAPPVRSGRTGLAPSFVMRRGRKVSRARKPIKQTGKYVKRHYDDAGLILKNHCAWAGFQDHGSQNRMFSAIGEALTKAMFATQKIYFLSYDERLKPGISAGSPIAYEYRYLKLKFKRLNFNGASETIDTSIDLFDSTTNTGKTFKQISEDVANLCRLKADVTDEGTTSAYYPYSFTWGAAASDNIEDGTTHYDLGEAMVDVYVKQVITFQNQTLDDGGGDTTTAIDANPVKAKVYHFNHKIPRLIDRVQETLRVENATVDNFQYDAPIRTNGINTSVTMENEDSAMAHAPPAKQWATNCTGVQNFAMDPGKARSVVTTFKIKSSMKNLVERMYVSGYGKGTFGKSTWVAIQHVHKTPAHTQIRVPFTRKVLMGARVSLRRQKSMLSHYEF